MTPTDIFDTLKHFSRGENWGNPDKVNPSLLIIMDYMRGFIDSPIHINNAFSSSGHISYSFHYDGWAVDFTLPRITLLQAHARIKQFLTKSGLTDKVGLGIYPQWNTPGFHIDVRDYKARWGKVNGVYVSYENALTLAKG